jgi:NAD(P)-dependent dehydrogenase (short-subunit alcohol dehydrogenase family)
MQHPLNTGYTARTTANDMIKDKDMTGKVVIITGGSAGLGLETTKALASTGAQIIVPARRVSEAKHALNGFPNVVIFPEEFDLSKRNTIVAFVQWFQSQHEKLDILINCAGIMAIPKRKDEYGNELQISVNYLGHYYLINGLLPQLKNANGARVVNLSSRGHWFGEFDFEDPNFEFSEYDKWLAYGRAKTAVSLLSVALDDLYKKDNIRAFSVHPGSIVTNLSRNLSDQEMREMGALTSSGTRGFENYNNENKTVSEGAATIVWCAISSVLDGIGGVYCENCDIAPIALDEEMKIGVKPWAVNLGLAHKLWRETPNIFY